MKLLKTSAALLALAITSAPALAEDVRVKTRLEAAKLKYQVDDDGDYQLVFDTENGRSQLVFINSKTSTVGSMEIRDVWSIAVRASNIPPAAIRDMLSRNANYILGSWSMRTMGGHETLIFTIPVNVTIPANELAYIAGIVAEVADEVEKELLGSDDY